MAAKQTSSHLGKSFLTVRAAGQWKMLPGEAVTSSSPVSAWDALEIANPALRQGANLGSPPQPYDL